MIHILVIPAGNKGQNCARICTHSWAAMPDLTSKHVKLLMSRSLHQAALLHKFLHERVNFMIDLFGLQFGIRAGLPPLDFSVLAERMVLSLLARRLIELFLNIGIRFIFGSFGLRLGMAGPVIAIGFRRHREAVRQKGIVLLLTFSIRH